MKIAIVTANVGSIDKVLPIPEQSIDCDIYCYDETNLPYPLTNLNNRLKAKYIKLRTHEFLPDYEAYIWIDGRVEIVSEHFAREMIGQLQDRQMTIFRHKDRKNIFEELQYIQNQIQNGNSYHIERYSDQPIAEESAFCRKQSLPQEFPLFWCGLFARWNNEVINVFFDEWWMKCLEFSTFDQALFSYLAWKAGINLNVLEFPAKSFRINRHGNK